MRFKKFTKKEKFGDEIAEEKDISNWQHHKKTQMPIRKYKTLLELHLVNYVKITTILRYLEPLNNNGSQ